MRIETDIWGLIKLAVLGLVFLVAIYFMWTNPIVIPISVGLGIIATGFSVLLEN